MALATKNIPKFYITFGAIPVLLLLLSFLCSAHDHNDKNKPPLVSPTMYTDSSEEDFVTENPASDDHHTFTWDTEHIAKEREHLQEHVEVPTVDTSKMTEEELQFHYFKSHDSDNNQHLDGVELMKSATHWQNEQNNDHDKDGKATEGSKQTEIFSDEQLAGIVDPILERFDLNGDGLISYTEFKTGLP